MVSFFPSSSCVAAFSLEASHPWLGAAASEAGVEAAGLLGVDAAALLGADEVVLTPEEQPTAPAPRQTAAAMTARVLFMRSPTLYAGMRGYTQISAGARVRKHASMQESAAVPSWRLGYRINCQEHVMNWFGGPLLLEGNR